MASDILALMVYVWYAGRATAARMPMIATTIISSIRVKPCWTVRFILGNSGRRWDGEAAKAVRRLSAFWRVSPALQEPFQILNVRYARKHPRQIENPLQARAQVP